MKAFHRIGTALIGLALSIGIDLGSTGSLGVNLGVEVADAAKKKSDACTPPTKMLGNPWETAWRLWVAATCPVNSDRYPYVVWENWVNQRQLYPADPDDGLRVPNSLASDVNSVERFRPSPLAYWKKHGHAPTQDVICTSANAPPANDPDLVICEEVRINGAAEDYIAGRGLWNREGQTAVAAAGGEIEFPVPSIEIKADWLVLDSCEDLPEGVHVERIEGTCYALAGMHLSSKLLDNWLWATFEPQNLETNPNRCAVLGCYDPWGSNPPRSNGGAAGQTLLTGRLYELMARADLAPVWQNYRLDGVQVKFGTENNPTRLGNSIIEGENVGQNLEDSSCITCHALSSIENDGTDGITLLTGDPIGPPESLPSDAWIRRDFVWSLSLACPDSLLQTCE